MEPKVKTPHRKSLGQRMAEAIARREARTGQRHVYAHEYRGANAAQLAKVRS